MQNLSINDGAFIDDPGSLRSVIFAFSQRRHEVADCRLGSKSSWPLTSANR
jgi:hypothetical protein